MAMNQADVAWMLVATALVLLMTPALAFFYGGLVRSKNALNTMMMSFVALGVVGIVWALIGYSLAFAPGNGVVGGLSRALLRNVGLEAQGSIPHVLFMSYQGTFAIITAALISAALVLGPRKDFARQAFLPHNVPFTLLGAGLLWFGWFGFNAGSALAASPSAALAFTTTFLAPMGTLVVWTLLDMTRNQKVTAVGGATAIVVGLVAITPAAGFISPMSAIALGAIAAVPSYYALVWRVRTRLDDSLDVVAAHGLGGTVGALLTGVFAEKAWNTTTDGLLFGNPAQLGIQAAAVLAAAAYSGVLTFALLKLVALVMPLRAEVNDEGIGMDVSQHGEEAYADGEGAILVLPDRGVPAGSPVMATEGGRA